VQAAFLGTFFLPPPTACPKRLAHADGSGAWRTAYAWIKFVVQRVVVDVFAGNEVPHIPPGPIGQRVVFGAALAGHIGGVDQGHFGACIGLFAAQAGDPNRYDSIIRKLREELALAKSAETSKSGSCCGAGHH